MTISRAFKPGVTPEAFARRALLEAYRAERPDRHFSLPLLRLREIERVVVSRHGLIIPDPEDTDDRSWCLDYARGVVCSVTPQDPFQWARRWMPWAGQTEVDSIVAQEGWRERMIGADDLAAMLFVDADERAALALRTIGARDVSKSEREAAAAVKKRERDRQSQADKRRAEGRVDRATYLEKAATANRPWEEMGICRRTWERRQARVASVSPVSISITNSDTPATDAVIVEEQARRAA